MTTILPPSRPNPARPARRLSTHAIAATLLLTAATAAAQTGGKREDIELSGSLAMGAEHNNNLSIAELESASGRSDTALTFDGGANLRWTPSPGMTLEGGYNYTMSRYQDIDSYDLDLHLLFADLSRELGSYTIGGNYYRAMAKLGGDDFLDLDQYSLYAGKLFGEQWYLRAALNFSEKDFDSFNQRDADNDGFSMDLYHFFNQGRSNLMFGYAREHEDTRGPSFDYDADTLRLRLNHRMTLASHTATLQLGYRYQDRDYASITPSIGMPRDDNQRVADASIEVELVEALSLVSRIEHGDYRSRLPSADFTDRRVSFQLKYSF